MSGQPKQRVGAARAAAAGWLAGLGMWVLLPWGAMAEGSAAAEDSAAEVLQLPRQNFSEPVLDSLRTALGIYEDLRAELAADRLQGLFVDGTRLAGALRMALLGGEGELAGQIPDAIHKAVVSAEALAEVEDLAAARIAFGEVSRYLLLVGGTDPGLAEGWHVYACPMAEGFHKWLQPMEKMANPYMGPAMLVCGVASDWPEPAPAATGGALAAAREAKPAAARPAGPEPEFKPGIPGLRMMDVRDHKFLWREIEQLQMWERGDRISIAEFRSKAIEKTAHFLGFGGAAADEFAAVAAAAVASVRDSFHQERASGNDPSGLEAQFTSDLREAATRVISLFEGKPRHQLFEPACKKWLLKLAFGPREREETREAEQTRADKSARGGSGNTTGVP